MAYGVDLRGKVLEAVDAERGTKTAIAAMFGVTRQWINQLLRRRTAERAGTLAAPAKRGPKPRLDAAAEARLRALAAAKPDRTVADFHAALAAPVGRWTVWKALRRLGLTFKKRPSAPTNVNAPTWPPRGRPGGRASRPGPRPAGG